MTILQLSDQPARAFMTPAPVAVRAFVTVREAVAMMVDLGVAALPVVDSDHRPVGVLSQTDIVRHDREKTDYPLMTADFYGRVVLDRSDKALSHVHIENVDAALVTEVMTPLVYAVTPETPLTEIVGLMLAKHVHRVFVLDEQGILIGVVSTFDILRQLETV